MLSVKKEKIVLAIEGFDKISQNEFSVVMDLLTKQLNGELEILDHKIKLSFLPVIKR